jgi:hypothetical protein
MKTSLDKKPESKNHSAISDISQKGKGSGSAIYLEDNRARTTAQLKKQKSGTAIPGDVIQMARRGGGGNPQGRGGKGKKFSQHSGKAGRGKMPMAYKPQYNPKPKPKPKKKDAPAENLRFLDQQARRGVQALPPVNVQDNLLQIAAPQRPETPAEKIARLKRQYTEPSDVDRQKNRELDETEEKETTALLMESLSKVIPAEALSTMSFRQLEFEYAQLVYSGGSLKELHSMKGFNPKAGTGLTQFDLLRQSRIAIPGGKFQGSETEKYKSSETEKHLQKLIPKLAQLSNFIRLTHYYDADAEASILSSGRLQSKERRMKKAKGKKVPNKSSKMDDQLGNTDHVFFFAEYEEEKEHAKFRKTRFGGDPDESDAALHQKPKLDGTERRVSFPLNSMPMAGMHGYVADLNSQNSLNPVHHIFSAMPMHEAPQQQAAAAAAQAAPPPPGTHFLMDLLRQRFTQSNFPGKKKEDKMVKDLLDMSMREFYEFLFRKHPKKDDAAPINPQILVPGSVPFQTPGVRFDAPSEKDIAESEK